jgi:micrococcal nuclease
VVAALLVLGGGCGGAPPPSSAGEAVVVDVVDGDTVHLSIAGRTETARLLGIDTPETKHPTKPVECYGAEAQDRLAAVVPPGTTVRVERDQEARDRYGRLLVYVYRHRDDLFVNRLLVEEGYATTLIISPNGAHRNELEQAAATARADARGLWGSCGGPDSPLADPDRPVASPE